MAEPTEVGVPAEHFTEFEYNQNGLLDEDGAPTAVYGYTAYGEPDEALTAELLPDSGQEPDPTEQVNPFRYSSKRTDALSGTIDMGARQFGPELGQFLQADQFDSALADVGLASDPLTNNRYALAGGNPISFIEIDGHAPDWHLFGGKVAPRYEAQTPASIGSDGSTGSSDSTDPAPVVNVRPPDAGRAGATLVTPSDVGGSRDPNVLENAAMPGNPGWRALMPPRDTGPGIQPFVDFLVPQTAVDALLFIPCRGIANKICREAGSSALKAGSQVVDKAKDLGGKAIDEIGRRLGLGGAAVTTGQRHDVISTRIGRAIERHPTLAGQYSRREPSVHHAGRRRGCA